MVNKLTIACMDTVPLLLSVAHSRALLLLLTHAHARTRTHTHTQSLSHTHIHKYTKKEVELFTHLYTAAQTTVHVRLQVDVVVCTSAGPLWHHLQKL